MPETIRCPFCNRKLTLTAEVLGQNVICPLCGMAFFVAAAQHAFRENTPAAIPGSPSRPAVPSAPPSVTRSTSITPALVDGRHLVEEESLQDRNAWRNVCIGITLILYSIGAVGFVILAFCIVAPFAALIATGNSAGQGDAKTAGESGAIVLLIVDIFMVVGGLIILGVRIAGQVFCVAAPRKHGAKGLAMAALLLTIVGLLLLLGISGLGLFERASGKPPLPMDGEPASALSMVLNMLSNGAVLFESIVFLLFLRAVALGVHDRALSQRIVYLMMVGGTIVVFIIGVLVIGRDRTTGATMPGADPQALGQREFENASPLLGLFGCTFWILFVTFSVWYIVTLFQVRSAIAVHLRRLSAVPC